MWLFSHKVQATTEEMSDRRGYLHFRRNYAEELRIKKELERLLKPPHRAIRHDMVKLRPKSSSPLSLMQDPSIPQSNQFHSLSRPRSGVRSKPSSSACHSAPTSSESKRTIVSITADIRLDDNKACMFAKDASSISTDVAQKLEDQTQLQHGHLYVHKETPETEHNVTRPAIASMVGTTKPIMVFTRPEPPSKPRSYIPQDSGNISTKSLVIEKKRTKKQRVTPAPSSKTKKSVDVRSSEDSDDTSTSSSSDFQDSDDSVKRIKSRKKKKKNSLKKSKTLSTSEQVHCGRDNPTNTSSLIADKSSHVVTDQSNIMGTIEGANVSVVSPFKTTARSVDEIIASLRSPQSYTASDLMIKQLMESVLGLDYNVTSGETTEEKSDVQEKESKQLQLENTSSAEVQPPEPHVLQVPKADITLDDKLSTPLSFSLVKDEEEPSHQGSMLTAEESITSLKVEEMTEGKAKEILKSSAQISISDIIHVKGDAAQLMKRTAAKTPPSTALLATWKPKTKFGEHQTIHHLCTLSPNHVLPSYLQVSSRVHHTMDRKGHNTEPVVTISPKGNTIIDANHHLLPACEEEIRLFQDGILASSLQFQDQKGSVITLPPQSPQSLQQWQKIAEYYVEGPRMQLVGEQASLNPGTLKMFWAPAPPKFSAPLSLMQKTLFSKYESCLGEQDEIEEFAAIQTNSESSDEESIDPEDLAMLDRILSRKCKSLSDIHLSSSSAGLLMKSSSTPDLSSHRTCLFHLSADFQTSMKELEMWKQQNYKAAKPPFVIPGVHDELHEEQAQTAEPLPDSAVRPDLLVEKGKDFLSDVGIVTTHVLKNVIPFKKKSKKRKRLLDPAKFQDILLKLNQPSRIIERSISFVRTQVRHSPAHRPRSMSLPCQLDFSSFLKTHGGIYSGQDVREWVRDIWNNWFDEVFPSSQTSIEDEHNYFDMTDGIHSEQVPKEAVSWAIGLDSIPPLLVEDPAASVQDVMGEISDLTNMIEQQKTPSIFHYCRRGALNRKIGNLTLAIQDLDLVIKHEPQLLDAYWHRHLIYLLQGKTSEALDDLNFIIKYNKTHTDAYLSKAEIYKQKKDYTMSIVNYTQALKCRPTDDDIYYRRAQMYEAQDELIIAMDDYSQCYYHNPSRTDALMKHGLYYFENSNWNVSVQDFTAVIKQEFNNVEARMYRGRAYTELARYSEAAEDFSAVIHLDPKNWMAFYYRGCLLRKCYPKHALQDFSVSVLLNDEFENLNAFLYRGVLYTDLGLWNEAAFDFEHVLALDKAVPMAHVNLGLICLLHRNQYTQAVRHFSGAIKVDPLYIRAYLCRAQAYRQMKDLHSALKDITRAIHLRPDSPEPYIIRGQYLYEMKRYDLASFCIHHTAEMTHGSSPVQQALVQSFLHQNNSAIDCLVSAIKDKPSSALIILLGKIQMKAKKNKEASESFRQALDLLNQLDERSPSTDKAEVFYLLGLCYMEQFKFLQAFEALTSAVKNRSGYCDAYYQRGLCRMRLQQSKCVEDFNKALQINPRHFQAYLCRAAFYGFRKRYSKAITNCNAAIRVQPHGVRAYLYRGALKYYIKAYKLAIQDLTKATELDPSCSLVYYNRGVCFHQIKMYEEALKDYAIVLLLGGGKEVDVKVLVNRGLLYLELHDYANALEDFKAVAIKTPDDVKIHQVIGNCHHRLQQYKEAMLAFSQVLQINSLTPEGYIGRGNAYMEYGHKEGTKRAQADFMKALHLKPTSIAARICLGYNLQAQGLLQQAWNQFTVALDIDARSMLGFEGRAIVNLQMGDTFAALQDMNAALKLGVTAHLLTNRGVIHQFMGKLPNAMRDYQSAIAANSKYSLAYFNAANLYLHNRQFSQAKEYYTQAIELDPDNESAFLNRGITNMLLQDVQEALEDFHRVINLCPVSSAAFFNRATLHNTLQEYQQAESDITQAMILQPGDPLMYKLRADIRGKMGLAKEAIEDYEQAITILQQSSQNQ
ncbi:tetratricopeptide repeat protein 6 [Hyla sarda]|uniref:tetratricopeptide repeat protein 6 n=1 Tax=Hyla sarda TaxID=327740 RepID=UPI0024C2D19A|nr:tetratricopeptide repeat protein 6 [Hyla sarda]